MRRYSRIALSTLLPVLLLALWTAFAALTGGSPVSGAPSATAVGANAVTPVRADTLQRAASATRSDPRRTPVAPVQTVVAADSGDRPAGPPTAASGPVTTGLPQPVTGREAVGPRQERAPPARGVDTPRTRAPPSPHGN
ncbi:hypothetical protein [Streptomyces tsukubensis]|uniref:Secreted protein n=1 Tax=Streptomyces tsukubensis (strain DSM 42081 / NBRC 108919 / NRRL 18488 / 9993) TaxID=1114943 RepID=A0A7G3U7K2_STRT9|nr:hypothetical protein [Streptomyces tsukubensis]AZK98129.1 hypothetical protein B7R87_32730 [Streptomyces tsukubensis]QKM65948.1 hypothetical protein STSU_001030 [Streptomyces tsukubensis NRRL18488]TAI42234.1 hypothetical protein EWI31_21770 [Streptomyces tsukubensis]